MPEMTVSGSRVTPVATDHLADNECGIAIIRCALTECAGDSLVVTPR